MPYRHGVEQKAHREKEEDRSWLAAVGNQQRHAGHHRDHHPGVFPKMDRVNEERGPAADQQEDENTPQRRGYHAPREQGGSRPIDDLMDQQKGSGGGNRRMGNPPKVNHHRRMIVGDRNGSDHLAILIDGVVGHHPREEQCRESRRCQNRKHRQYQVRYAHCVQCCIVLGRSWPLMIGLVERI